MKWRQNEMATHRQTDRQLKASGNNTVSTSLVNIRNELAARTRMIDDAAYIPVKKIIHISPSSVKRGKNIAVEKRETSYRNSLFHGNT